MPIIGERQRTPNSYMYLILWCFLNVTEHHRKAIDYRPLFPLDYERSDFSYIYHGVTKKPQQITVWFTATFYILGKPMINIQIN